MHFNLYCRLYLKIFILLFFLNHCQLHGTKKNHGIVYLENRAKKVIVNETNSNDVLQIFGQPHFKTFNNDSEWVYVERVLVKGEFHKLGQNVLSENNILVLSFNKFGILKEKKFLDKNDKKKLKFSESITENKLTERSFVQKFLQSVKTKMYGNR